MKKIITISTGTELILGQVEDRDFSFMARQLALAGYPVYRHYVVGDDAAQLQEVFSDALRQADILIMTGGLGPTTDDLTRVVVSKVLGLLLKIDQEVLKDIQKKFARRGLEVPECSGQQAFILEGAQVISNTLGTAPGMVLEHKRKHIFLLPGPPFELQPMFESEVLPKIKGWLEEESFHFLTFRTFGILESKVQELMCQILNDRPELLNELGYTSSPQGVDVRVAARQNQWSDLQPFIQKIEGILGPWIYGRDAETLHEVTAKLLMEKKKTVAIAESCTGGLVSERLTSVPGVSDVFKLGLVAYSNQAKIDLLSVSEENLDQWGAVSEQIAIEMARGIRDQAKSDLGLSITGIAGPTGGTAKKPVGLVWIGLHSGRDGQAKSYRFLGDREAIQFKASQAALDTVRRFLMGDKFLGQDAAF